MRHRYIQHEEGGVRVGQVLAFMVVVSVSAGAFLTIGANRPSPVARVVSMDAAQSLGDRTASIVEASEDAQVAAIPVPLPRPE